MIKRFKKGQRIVVFNKPKCLYDCCQVGDIRLVHDAHSIDFLAAHREDLTTWCKKIHDEHVISSNSKELI